jgi:predicted Zn-dependent peptidase
MKEYQRKQLLERIDREGATVGTQIPDTIVVQGEEIDLQEFVFEITRRDTYPAGERERVENAKRNLRRERLQRRQRIENNEVDFEDGQKLAESIIGISRALEALQGLDPDDIEGEAKRQETADRKRWMSFLKQAMGHEDASRSGGRL